MTIPALIIGVVISTLYGAVFHLLRGGSLGRLILYIMLSWLGFWIGNSIGEQMGWIFWSMGPLRLGMATLGSVVFLGVGYWLSLVKVERS
jgi:hypothetical protein